jgi:hypothetical protein
MPDSGYANDSGYSDPDSDWDKVGGGPIPAPPAQQWDPTTFHAPPTRSGPTPVAVEAPQVPTGTGKGGSTVVNTPSLDQFASNMGQLAEPVKKAYTMVLNMKPVLPGDFFDAYKLAQATTGDGGLQAKYLTLLHSLGQGLTDIGSGCQQLSQKYSTIEEDNKMSADDVMSAMQPAQGDFSKFTSGE